MPPRAPLDYSNLPDGPKRPMPWWNWLFLVGALAILLLLVWPEPGANSADSRRRIRCMSQLRQIGLASLIYATRHNDCLPDSLASLYQDGELTADVLICPSTNHQVATGPTTRAIADAIASTPPTSSPQCRCSYVYVGANLTLQSSPSAVIAYEPPSNHGGAGGSVVYADGRVLWHETHGLARIIASLNAGQNPPP